MEERDRIRRRESRVDLILEPGGREWTREELARDVIARDPEAVLFRKYPIGVRREPRLIHVGADERIIGDGFELLPVAAGRLIARRKTPQSMVT